MCPAWFGLLADLGEDCCQRNQLRLVGKINDLMDVLLPKEFGGF